MALRGLCSLMLALLLSGCATDPASAPAPPGTSLTAAAPLGTGTATAPLPGGAPAPQARWEAFPIAWDGKMGRSLCLPSGLNSCNGVPEASTPGQSSLFLDAPGSVSWNLTWTVSWTPDTPATGELTATVLRFESCGDGCSMGAGVESKTGPSPLSFDLKGIRMEGNETGLWLSLDMPRQTPSPVYAQATLEQAFRFEGAAVAKLAR